VKQTLLEQENMRNGYDNSTVVVAASFKCVLPFPFPMFVYVNAIRPL
jgi:hypothetical protein